MATRFASYEMEWLVAATSADATLKIISASGRRRTELCVEENSVRPPRRRDAPTTPQLFQWSEGKNRKIMPDQTLLAEQFSFKVQPSMKDTKASRLARRFICRTSLSAVRTNQRADDRACTGSGRARSSSAA